MNKEELAFKNIEELSQEDELILYDIIDFLQKDRKQWINQFSKTHNENVELQQKVNQLEINRDVLKEYIQNLIYNIEPEGVRINFNCEYDSEEDYIRGMEQKSRLETLKEVLSKIEILERGKE